MTSAEPSPLVSPAATRTAPLKRGSYGKTSERTPTERPPTTRTRGPPPAPAPIAWTDWVVGLGLLAGSGRPSAGTPAGLSMRLIESSSLALLTALAPDQ